MATAWQLTDFENNVLLAIREVDACNFGGVPNFGQTFNKALIDQAINQAIADTVMMSGFQPRLTDRIVSTATTTAVDVPLPADCVGLQRLEYLQAPTIQTVVTSGPFAAGTRTLIYNPLLLSPAAVIEVGTALILDTLASGVQETVQVTAVNTLTANDFTVTCAFPHAALCRVESGPFVPYRLEQVMPDEFDSVAGTGYYSTSIIELGLPTTFREPIANAVRFYPQISSTQVANGDTLIYTYTSYGLQLVANTDVAALPVSFQRGIVFAACVDLWRVKGDEDQSDRAEKRWMQWCAEARKFRWNLPQAGTFGIMDEMETPLTRYNDDDGGW